MIEQDWDTFADLVDMIVNHRDGESWRERREQVKEELAKRVSLTAFTELVSWFMDEEDET